LLRTQVFLGPRRGQPPSPSVALPPTLIRIRASSCGRTHGRRGETPSLPTYAVPHSGRVFTLTRFSAASLYLFLSFASPPFFFSGGEGSERLFSIDGFFLFFFLVVWGKKRRPVSSRIILPPKPPPPSLGVSTHEQKHSLYIHISSLSLSSSSCSLSLTESFRVISHESGTALLFFFLSFWSDRKREGWDGTDTPIDRSSRT